MTDLKEEASDSATGVKTLCSLLHCALFRLRRVLHPQAVGKDSCAAAELGLSSSREILPSCGDQGNTGLNVKVTVKVISLISSFFDHFK